MPTKNLPMEECPETVVHVHQTTTHATTTAKLLGIKRVQLSGSKACQQHPAHKRNHHKEKSAAHATRWPGLLDMTVLEDCLDISRDGFGASLACCGHDYDGLSVNQNLRDKSNKPTHYMNIFAPFQLQDSGSLLAAWEGYYTTRWRDVLTLQNQRTAPLASGRSVSWLRDVGSGCQ